MKQEHLSFLADSPFYTKRFAFYMGKRCSTSTIKDVAKEFHLDRRAVKELEMQYMLEKLRRAGTPGPKVIGIDEISIRKVTRTGSWSATWRGVGQSGSEEKTARKKA